MVQVGYSEYNKLNLSKLIMLKTVSEALHSNNEQSSNLLQPLVTQLVALIKIKIHSCYLYRAFFWWKTMALWMSSSDLMPRARGISTTWTARWRYSTRSLSSMCGVARTRVETSAA